MISVTSNEGFSNAQEFLLVPNSVRRNVYALP